MTNPTEGVALPPENTSSLVNDDFVLDGSAPAFINDSTQQPAAQQAETPAPVDTNLPSAETPADDGFVMRPPVRQAAPETPEAAPDLSPSKSALETLPKIAEGGKTHRVILKGDMLAAHVAPVDEEVPMPSSAASRSNDIFSAIPNFAPQPGGVNPFSDSDTAWINVAQSGSQMHMANEAFEGALSREGSQWTQGVVHGNRHLRGVIPKFKTPTNSVVSGPEAVRMAMSYFSLGDFVAAPMWSSGFWVVFQPAPDTAWIELNRLLASEEIRLGRDTYGLAHANTTALTQETIINFLLPYVYNTTVDPKQMAVTDIPKYLSMHDIQSFIWGFIWANYPKGFKIERSCLVDPSNCRDVTVATIDVSDMQITDHPMLTDYHLNHMVQRTPGVMSLDSVKEYQKRLPTNLESVVEIKNSLGKTATITFNVPSSDSQFLAANRYVEALKNSVLRTVTREVPTAVRDKLMNEYMTATQMCLYDHLVKSIEFDGVTVDTVEDIDKMLSLFTRDGFMRVDFFKKAAAFLDQSVVAMIGIRAYKCPKCGGDHSQHNEAHPEFSDFIPLDMIQLFSHLAEYRTRLVQART